ncbi:MAG TPA: hypothetical protein DEP88_04195 [Verrucomicrobiales bacterium]|jgi:hypothetical protein|nr:hypothetical protein [Verrucomicrobiales bacterium]HCI91502.1 hypothetical protein [Verrucomicrobiales bacterium]HCL97237.1 hypothetical protein [Verrucomicrobiales bacterium]
MNKIQSLIAIIALVMCACSDKKETSDNTDIPQVKNAISELIIKNPPADAKGIFETRKVALPGDIITIKGKVMGSENPLVNGRAIMLLGDPNILTSCDLKPGDACTKPWDVCCDSPEDIKASVLTVQVVDNDGSPVKTGFKGVSGIKELSQLVVTGVVAEGSNKDNLLLNATAIYVNP